VLAFQAVPPAVKVFFTAVDSDAARFVRTCVVLLLTAGILLATGKSRAIAAFSPKTWLFLILSGCATGLSWLCYFRALDLRDAARVALTVTQRQLIAQLEEAYSEATTARDQLASLDLSAATAEESLRLTKLRYSEGEATVLEVVDAQNAFVSAENAREDGRVRIRRRAPICKS